MSIKKHYPDAAKVRYQVHKVRSAILTLAEMCVEIVAITFEEEAPLIAVKNCPGLAGLNHPIMVGRGEDSQGVYVQKVAHVSGCKVEWREAA